MQISRYHWIVLGVAGVFGFGAYFTGTELQMRASARNAQAALNRNHLDEAQHHVGLALKVRPNNAAALLLAARIARRRDALDQAEQYLDRLRVKNAATALERDLLSAQQGDLEYVADVLRSQAFSDSIQAPMIFEAMIKGLMLRLRWTEASMGVELLLERQPDNPPALLLRGKIWESILEHDPHSAAERAQPDYARALELDPHLTEARLRLAGVLYRQGHALESAEQFECLRQSQPESAEIQLGLARCRRDLNQLQEAEQHLATLLHSQPKHVVALMERGRLALHRGQAAEAEIWLTQAVAVAPPLDSEPLRLLAFALAAQGKTAAAEKCGQQEEQIKDENLRIVELMSRAKATPSNAPLRHEVGTTLARLGRVQDSLSWFFSALEIDPRYGPAHQALAEHFAGVGQTARAERHLQAANPGNP